VSVFYFLILVVKYFSMFSGIGGFEYGIQNAYRSAERGEQTNPQGNQGQGLLTKEGQDTSTEDGRISERPTDGADERPLCIGYSEIDKYAIQVYEKHFKHKNYGDATKINPRELPDFDLLVGGFPCQAFSIAGKRKGFDDTRGTLFFDIARICAEKRPRLVVLENVKGLLSHEGGKTFQTIIGVLTDMGYFVEWQVLNSKNFGVPQNRERVFIIGYLGGQPRRKVFPLGAINSSSNPTKELPEPISNTLRTNYFNGKSNEVCVREIQQLNQPTHSNDRIYGTDGISPTLNTMQGGNRQPFVAPVLTPDRLEKRQNGRRFKHTLRNMGIRRLTPVECERLQGFPDGWTEGISDTQRYKCLGNAITTNVVEYVFEKLLKTK